MSYINFHYFIAVLQFLYYLSITAISDVFFMSAIGGRLGNGQESQYNDRENITLVVKQMCYEQLYYGL